MTTITTDVKVGQEMQMEVFIARCSSEVRRYGQCCIRDYHVGPHLAIRNGKVVAAWGNRDHYAVDVEGMTKDGPRYYNAHSCDTYLGRFGRFDLYVCTNGYVIARSSDSEKFVRETGKPFRNPKQPQNVALQAAIRVVTGR